MLEDRWTEQSPGLPHERVDADLGRSLRDGILASLQKERAFPLLDLLRRETGQADGVDALEPFPVTSAVRIELLISRIQIEDIRNDLAQRAHVTAQGHFLYIGD